ncbi:MAG: hypothetical protein AABZ19_05060 [Pseudomonadota bacterium]
MFDGYEKRQPLSFWQITGAVCLGILTAHTVEIIVATAITGASLQWAAYELDKNAKAAQAAAEQRATNDERKRKQALAENKAAQQAAAEAEQQRRLAKAKKETAWAQFYKRDPACDDNPNTATFTRCANEHIKAKTIFEATYKP